MSDSDCLTWFAQNAGDSVLGARTHRQGPPEGHMGARFVVVPFGCVGKGIDGG